jgi:hypothetical protein
VRFLNRTDPDFRSVSQGNDTVLVRLLKSLYGLKQASANWYEMATGWIKSQGFQPCDIDSCVLIRGQPSDKTLFIILLHVDDLLIISLSKDSISQFRDAMAAAFGDITFQDNNICFLGMTLERQPSGDVLIRQPGYTDKICRVEGSRHRYRTPSTATLFSDLDDPAPASPEASTRFKSLLMSAMFLATRTRPDILKECTFLASFGVSPGPKSFAKLRRIYGYLRHTQHLGLILGAATPILRLYTDASYAVHNNGRSHCYCYWYRDQLCWRCHCCHLLQIPNAENCDALLNRS